MENKRIISSNERIRQLISILGISQIEFCTKTGITPPALSNYVKDYRVPRQDALSKIADAYGVSPAWLMGYDVPMDAEAAHFYIHSESELVEHMLKEMADRPDKLYQALLIAARGCTPEQIKVVIETLNAFKKTNKNKK